jgi:hypothetical protein
MQTPTFKYHLMALVALLIAAVVVWAPSAPDWTRCAAMLLALLGVQRLLGEAWMRRLWWAGVVFAGLGLLLSIVV